MNKVDIPRDVVERVIQRRGREHIFDDFDPALTALVVVDMQNAFMLPEVAHAFCAHAPSIVPNINRLAKATREAGGIVVWIQTASNEESKVGWSILDDMAGPQRTAKRDAALKKGSKGWEIWAGLDVQPHDLVVEKRRFSAFIQGSSDLEPQLRARGIDTVLITGTVTNTCCESTARDAMMVNFKTIMVSDGNAGNSDAEHNATLLAFYQIFGDVMPTDLVVSLMRQNRAGQRAAS